MSHQTIHHRFERLKNTKISEKIDEKIGEKIGEKISHYSVKMLSHSPTIIDYKKTIFFSCKYIKQWIMITHNVAMKLPYVNAGINKRLLKNRPTITN